MEIDGKVVIVTGAGSGVGRTLACEFAARGARVACAGRRPGPIEETAALIAARGGTALSVTVDVADRLRVGEMVERVRSSLDCVDVLFNNAGSFEAIGPVWEVDPDRWWHDVTVNLRGTMLCCRAVLPQMMERDRGIIINMSGGNRIPGGTGYSCSKIGVVRFTELLAAELAREGSSVLAFAIRPGFVRTEMTEYQVRTPAGRKWLPSSREAFERGADRPPEDCARTALELVRVAGPELSGGLFGPDTDFGKLAPGRGNC